MFDGLFKAPAPQVAESVLHLNFSRKPNAALAVPKALVPEQTYAMSVLETFALSTDPAAVLDQISSVLEGSETLVDRQDFGTQPGAVYTVRTRLMRYPDLIYVSLRPRQGGDSHDVLLYSHSVYGHSDLGANAKRLKRILGALSDI